MSGWLVYGLACAIVALALRDFVNWVRTPYSWKCSECGFSVRSNKRQVVEKIRETHIH